MITSEESLMSVDGSTITSPYKTEKDESGNDTKVTNFVQKAAANIVNWMDLLSDVEDDSDDNIDNEDNDIESSSNINQQQQYQQTKLNDTNVKSEASTNNSSEKEEAIVEIKQEPKIEVQDFEEDNAREACNLQVKTESNLVSFSGIIPKEEGKVKGEREIEIDFLDVANLAKYERLVKTEKLKSPFKRRLSDNSEKSSSCEAIDNKKSKIESRIRHNSVNSSTSSNTRTPKEYETDKELLARRQKQIDFGKNTLGYDNYVSQIPKLAREVDHPRTPPKHMKYSRRAWDGLVRVWRKKLHCWDPKDTQGATAESDDAQEEEFELEEQ